MSVHSYPVTAVIGDYTRTAAGLAISIVPFTVAPEKPLLTVLLLALVAAFVVYGLRTVIRHVTRVEVSDAGIHVNMPTSRAIAWTDLARMRLRFFSTKRNRATGWFQLVLADGKTTIAVESSIRGFDAIIEAAAAAAARNGLTLDEATAGNLAALTQGARPASS